jgi:hypothetical protein
VIRMRQSLYEKVGLSRAQAAEKSWRETVDLVGLLGCCGIMPRRHTAYKTSRAREAGRDQLEWWYHEESRYHSKHGTEINAGLD